MAIQVPTTYAQQTQGREKKKGQRLEGKFIICCSISWVRIEYQDTSADPNQPSKVSYYSSIVNNFKNAGVKTNLIIDYRSAADHFTKQFLFLYSSMVGNPGANGSEQQWQSFSVKFCQVVLKRLKLFFQSFFQYSLSIYSIYSLSIYSVSIRIRYFFCIFIYFVLKINIPLFPLFTLFLIREYPLWLN